MGNYKSIIDDDDILQKIASDYFLNIYYKYNDVISSEKCMKFSINYLESIKKEDPDLLEKMREKLSISLENSINNIGVIKNYENI